MSFEIADYLTLPDHSEWENNLGELTEIFTEIKFELANKSTVSFNLQDWVNRENEIYHLKVDFNNRIFDLVVNYILVKHFYNKGIPDDEWYRKNETGGYSFYPNFSMEHHGHQYWFNFHIESLYSRYVGLIDALFHMVNIKYRIDEEEKAGFRRRVLTKLKSVNEQMYTLMSRINKSKKINKITKIRNNIIHNQKPNMISSGIKRYREGNKMVTSFGLGEYTTSTEMLDIFNDSIKYLKIEVDKFKKIIND